MRLVGIRVAPLSRPNPASTVPVVGAASLTTFTYAVTGLGQTSVRLRYAQPFNVRPSARYLTIRLVGVRHARASAGVLHSVVTGDTLYRIARRTLGHGTALQVARLANRLYTDNRSVIGNDGNFLRPGEVLLIDPSGI
jgi:Tfp pilus assembly protein FimV